MHNVLQGKEDAWNKNLRNCIKSRFRSQAAFAEALNKKYGTSFNQRTVSRWVSVGAKMQSGSFRGFPEFINMIMIADILEVDLGYLIGETDHESFSMEKVCEFTGLSSKAINAIMRITSPDSAFQMVHMHYSESSMLLNNLLSAQKLCGFIENLKEMDDVFSAYEREIEKADKWDKEFDSDFVTQVREWNNIIDDPQYDGPAPSNDILAGIWKLRESIDIRDCAENECEQGVKSARYVLSRICSDLVEELYPHQSHGSQRYSLP